MLSDELGDMYRPLARFYEGWKAERSLKWGQMRASRGGAYFGKRWAPMQDQYTRQTDGVTVPAWGGVTKLQGKGKVKAKKRPSGQRVSKNSVLMQDTGAMRNSWLGSRPHIDENVLSIGLGALEYTKHQEKRRRFAFWARNDERMLANEVQREVDEIVARFNRR